MVYAVQYEVVQLRCVDCKFGVRNVQHIKRTLKRKFQVQHPIQYFRDYCIIDDNGRHIEELSNDGPYFCSIIIIYD